MKKLAFILLIVIVVSPCIVSAETTACKSPNANNEDLAEPGEIVIINFQGEIRAGVSYFNFKISLAWIR